MDCKIKFKGKKINKSDIENYFNDLKSKTGTKTGFTDEEIEEFKRVANMASIDTANPVQKFVIHKILNHHMGNKAVGDEYYENEKGEKLMRMTNLVGSFPEFEFTGDKDAYKANREWGTAVNEIFDIAISGGDISTYSSPYIDNATVMKIYNEFRGYDFGEGAVVLTQIKLSSVAKDKKGKTFKDADGNEYDGVAGTADIVVVDKDGFVTVLDLKSSINETAKPYVKVKGGVAYTNEYSKRAFKEKGSKKELHAAQLSGYYYMLKNLGLNMSEKNPIGIIPLHLKNVVGEKVYDAVLEPLINNHEIDSRFSSLDNTNNNNTLENILVNIKRELGKRLQKAQNEGKPTYFINTLIDAITGVDAAIGVKEFVNELSLTMLGSPSYIGHKEKLDKVIENYKLASPEDKVDYVNQIEAIKEFVDSMLESQVLKDLKNAILTGQFKDDSMLEEVRNLIDTMEAMKAKYDPLLIDMIAETLSEQVTPDMLANIVQVIKDEEEAIKKLEARQAKTPTKKRQRRIDDRKQKLQAEKDRFFVDENYNVDFKEVIKNEIEKGGYKDVGFLDRMLTPAISIDNSFLPTFVLTIKKAFDEVRMKIIAKTRESNQKFEKFMKGRSLIGNPPEELYKDFFTEVEIDGKKVLSMVTMVNWNTFLINKRKAQEEAKAAHGYNTPEYNEKMKEWYAENTETRPEEDIVVNGIVVIEGLNTIRAKKRKTMSKKNYERWLAQEDHFEYKMPMMSKYKDARFDKIKDEEFFIHLNEMLFEAQSMLPERAYDYEKYILPFVSKSGMDRFREQVIKEGNLKEYVSFQIRDRFSLTDADYNSSNYDAFAEENKSIPIMYYNRDNLMDSSEVTKDIYFSILKFYDEASKYQVQSKYRTMGDNLVKYAKGQSPAVTDYNGVKMLSRAAKLVGLENTADDYAKKNGNNIAAMLEMFVDVTIYGRRKARETLTIGFLNKKIDLGKIADSIMSFSSATQIAFNPLLFVANGLQGNVANLVDRSAEGLWKGTGAWAQAKKIYYIDSGIGGISDSLRNEPQTKIGLMVQRYDPIQGDYYDNFGRKLTRSKANNLMSTNSAYALSHISEHQIQVQGMIAEMKATKVKRIVNGVETETDMYEALEAVNGELKWKEGVIPIDENRFMNILHAKNKRLHGVYNSFDVIEMDRHSMSRLMMFYRKFLAPGWKYRWKQKGYDYELGDWTVGIYRTFYRKLFSETAELFRAVAGLDTLLTPLEQKAARRALMEHIILGLTGLIVIILSKIGDDDEDKYKYGYLLYFAMRLNAEISIYGGITDPRTPFMPNVEEMVSPFRSPTAAYGSINKIFKLYYSLIKDAGLITSGEDISRLERDSGMFEKGDSKSYMYLIKALGISKNISDIDEAIEGLMMSRGTN